MSLAMASGFWFNARTDKEQAAPLTIVTNWSAQFQKESKSAPQELSLPRGHRAQEHEMTGLEH
jgi:hypothetical protein